MDKLTTLEFIRGINKRLFDLQIVDKATGRICNGSHDRILVDIYLKNNSLGLLQSINFVIKSLRFNDPTATVDLFILPISFQTRDELFTQISDIFDESNTLLRENLAAYELERNQLKLF